MFLNPNSKTDVTEYFLRITGVMMADIGTHLQFSGMVMHNSGVNPDIIRHVIGEGRFVDAEGESRRHLGLNAPRPKTCGGWEAWDSAHDLFLGMGANLLDSIGTSFTRKNGDTRQLMYQTKQGELVELSELDNVDIVKKNGRGFVIFSTTPVHDIRGNVVLTENAELIDEKNRLAGSFVIVDRDKNDEMLLPHKDISERFTYPCILKPGPDTQGPFPEKHGPEAILWMRLASKGINARDPETFEYMCRHFGRAGSVNYHLIQSINLLDQHYGIDSDIMIGKAVEKCGHRLKAIKHQLHALQLGDIIFNMMPPIEEPLPEAQMNAVPEFFSMIRYKPRPLELGPKDAAAIIAVASGLIRKADTIVENKVAQFYKDAVRDRYRRGLSRPGELPDTLNGFCKDLDQLSQALFTGKARTSNYPDFRIEALLSVAFLIGNALQRTTNMEPQIYKRGEFLGQPYETTHIDDGIAQVHGFFEAVDFSLQKATAIHIQ